MKIVITSLLILILTVGCASQLTDTAQPMPTVTSSSTDEAWETLVKFFELLNSKQYGEASVLYGGDYETMQTWNPDIDPSDHIQLWEKGCEWNGLQCLVIRTATLSKQKDNISVFQVEFSNPDGSLFVRGPCCGANETEMPSESLFEYRVLKTADDKFLVMDMPLYVP